MCLTSIPFQSPICMYEYKNKLLPEAFYNLFTHNSATRTQPIISQLKAEVKI